MAFVYSLGRPGAVKAFEELKLCVYGENYEHEMGSKKISEASKKRKAINDNANKEYAAYDWPNLADNGQVALPFCLFSCRYITIQ